MTTVRAPHPRHVAQAPTAAEPSAASDRSPAATEVEPGAQVLGELVRDVLGSIVDLFTGPDAAASSAPPTQTHPGVPGPRVGSIETQHDVPAEALRVQQELADTRRALGAALEQEGELARRAEGDGVLADANGQRLTALATEINALRAQLSALEASEASQPREDVERARFEVFLDSFDALERSRGPEVASRLSRQAWYNDRKFNVAAGTSAASESDLLKTGFPRSPLMRSPSGDQIDMGHLTCALDWQLNPSPTHGLLVDLEEVTLTGDLAAAAQHLAATGGDPLASLDAQAGRADLLGDVDGLNLAARLRSNPGSDVGGLLRDYYATGSDADRLDELASHSRLFKRDASGAALQDEAGRWILDREVISEKVRTFTTTLMLLEYGSTSGALPKVSDSVDAILEAWASQELLALG
ncbi:MAG TPA: hypothetical protein VK013_13280 [Myxococcaceae bacterium]|nr:hypothetical protein [Myxococcaceae bacterium]